MFLKSTITKLYKCRTEHHTKKGNGITKPHTYSHHLQACTFKLACHMPDTSKFKNIILSSFSTKL